MADDSVLVFCAHSDDQILGPGGTLVKYAREGRKIYTVIFSYGERSHPWLMESITADMRMREAKAADKVIGGTGVTFLGLKEGKFEAEFREQDVESKVMSLMQEHKPGKVFIHSIDDHHADHKFVYRIIMDLLEKMDYRGDVYAFDIWNPLNFHLHYHPRMYVDITEAFPLKMRALKEFRSQWMTLLALRWSVYFRAFLNGLHINSRYAERFYKVR